MKVRISHVSFLSVLIMMGLCLLTPSPSIAKYPDRPIQLIIPFPAGVTADTTARLLADELGKIVGVKVIPMNKPGASATLGTDAVARGKKDGYTLLYGSASAMLYAPIAHPEIVHYDPFKDLEPLGLHFFFSSAIAVRSDAPWKTFAELVDYTKKNPGKVRISTLGVGSTPHFALEMLQEITGAKFTHVPLEEAKLTALLGGHVEATCDGFAILKPQMEAGKLKLLLATNKLPQYPQIPTITEIGYKQRLFDTWFVLYAAAGIPEEAKKVLIPAIQQAVKATKAKVDARGGNCEYKSPEEVKKIMDEEYKIVLEVSRKLGLSKK